MRAIALISALLAMGTSVLLTGCGSVRAPAAAPAAKAAGSASASASARTKCVTPKPAGPASPARTVTLTEKDTGKSFCVVAGTAILVFLHGSPEQMWTRVHANSTVLQPRPNGAMTLMRGVTGGSFTAARLGAASLSSVRPPCRPSREPSTASGSRCPAGTIFRVTVLVLGKM